MISKGLAVEFRVSEDDCPLARATRQADARVNCDPPPHLRKDGNVLLRFNTTSVDSGVEIELENDPRVSHVFKTSGKRSETIRCLSEQACVLHSLTDAGFLPTAIQYTGGTGVFEGEVVGRDILTNVLDAAGKAVGVKVHNIYEIDSDNDDATSHVRRDWNLTPAQYEAIREAKRMGYYDVPKAVTASEVADEVAISKSAFLQRVHRAERAIIDQLVGPESDVS